MGLLDSFMGILPEEGSAASNNLLDVGQALGMSLLQGNRQQPFANVAQNMAAVAASAKAGTSKSALKALLTQAGYSDAEAERLSSSEGVAKLAIQQKQQEKLLGSGGEAEPALFGGGGSAPTMSPAAPAGPAAGVSLNGSQADKAKAWYSEAIKQGASPLEAAAMVGNYTAENGLNTSGKPGDSGTAFGGGQWRADRFQNLQKLAAQRGESWDTIPAQVAHTLSEMNGGDAGAARAKALIAQAKTPEEAASIFAQHFERPSAQALADSLPRRTGAAAQAYRMFGQGASPTQVADASGAVPGMNPAIGMPNGRPQVAETEQQAQVLESRMGMYPPDVYGVAGAPKYGQDTATGRALAARQAGAAGASPSSDPASADMPAQGAQEAGFVIPPGAISAVERQIGAPPTPVSETTGPTTQRAQALANFNYWGRRLRAAGAFGGDTGKGLMEEAKIKMGLAQKYLEPSEAERLADAAGLSGQTRQQVLSGAIAGNANTGTQKEYGSYRSQEIAEGRIPKSQIEYQQTLSRANVQEIEKTENVERAKSTTGFLTDIAKGSGTVAKRAADLDLIGRIVSRTSTGSGATLKANLDRIGAELGFSSGKLATSKDALDAAVNRIAPSLRDPGSGAQSDSELRGFLSSLPSLTALPQGNQLILATLQRAGAIDRERAQIAAQWQANKLSASDARAKIAEIDARSIYANENEKQLVEENLGAIRDKPNSDGSESKTRSGWRVLGVE